jgi:hypothetical protein
VAGSFPCSGDALEGPGGPSRKAPRACDVGAEDPDDPGGRLSEAREAGLVLVGRSRLTTGEALDFRGPLRSKPINTARGTPGKPADLRRALPTALQRANGRHNSASACLVAARQTRPVGPSTHVCARRKPECARTLASRAPSVGAVENFRRRACRGLAKQYGGWCSSSFLNLVSPPSFST